MILAMGEVLGFGFIPCGDLSQRQKGQQGTHRVVAIKDNKVGPVVDMRLSIYIMPSCLRRYSVLLDLIH